MNLRRNRIIAGCMAGFVVVWLSAYAVLAAYGIGGPR